MSQVTRSNNMYDICEKFETADDSQTVKSELTSFKNVSPSEVNRLFAAMDNDLKCSDCKRVFCNTSGFKRHLKACKEARSSPIMVKLRCRKSVTETNDTDEEDNNLRSEIGEQSEASKQFVCIQCDAKFSRRYHLKRHMVQKGCDGISRPTYQCRVCGKMCKRKDNLIEHLRLHLGQTKPKKQYGCDHCNKMFRGLSMLRVHMRTHTGERPFHCDLCESAFSSSGALKKHRRKHTGERPYECKTCLAKFAAKETLNRHVKIHTNHKAHECQYCGKRFIQAAQLRAHIFNHTGEHGYICEYCNKAFNRRERLTLHVKYVHLGAEPFHCEKCEKPFIRKEDLLRHSIIHTGIKAHKCPICSKGFAIKSSLKIHLLTHTREPPCSCAECGRAFIRQDCLLRHMRTCHRKLLEEIISDVEQKKLKTKLLSTIKPDATDTTLLSNNIKELLELLIDQATLQCFGWPDAPVEDVLKMVIHKCGHEPYASSENSLIKNAEILFTAVIDDSSLKRLLQCQSVEDVILHVLKLAKSSA